MQRWDLGGGANPRPGFAVVDADPATTPDILWDLTDPPRQEWHGACQQATFYHGPEHYSRFEIPRVLQHIYLVMAPGAELEIRCPDMDQWARFWLERGATRDTLGCIFGAHTGPYQVHKDGLNLAYLRLLLEVAGFVGVERASEPGQAPLYPDDWRSPHGAADPNKRFDLHVRCRRP